MCDEIIPICEDCVTNHHLKTAIQTHGTPIALCSICQHANVKTLLANDPHFKRVFRALIRYHFNEYDYNSHLGGDALETLVREKASWFTECFYSSDAYYSAMWDLENDWYPKNEQDISLGGCYWEGWILQKVNDGQDREVLKLAKESLKQNYHDLLSDAIDLLSPLESDIRSIIRSGEVFVRARIGVKRRWELATDAWNPVWLYQAFSGDEICNPPMAKSIEGRLNRARVSVLYLASDTETAVAELRPHPGHVVSVAKFKSIKDLSVADFTEKDISNFLSDSRLTLLRRMRSFARLLALPVQPHQTEMYLVTQLLADALRLKFEAVKFSSSVGPGVNFAAFTPSAFGLMHESAEVVEVRNVTYTLHSITSVSNEEEMIGLREDTSDPFGTLRSAIFKDL